MRTGVEEGCLTYQARAEREETQHLSCGVAAGMGWRGWFTLTPHLSTQYHTHCALPPHFLRLRASSCTPTPFPASPSIHDMLRRRQFARGLHSPAPTNDAHHGYIDSAVLLVHQYRGAKTPSTGTTGARLPGRLPAGMAHTFGIPGAPFTTMPHGSRATGRCARARARRTHWAAGSCAPAPVPNTRSNPTQLPIRTVSVARVALLSPTRYSTRLTAVGALHALPGYLHRLVRRLTFQTCVVLFSVNVLPCLRCRTTYACARLPRRGLYLVSFYAYAP